MSANKDYNIVVDVDETQLEFQDFAGNTTLNTNVLHGYTGTQTQPDVPSNQEASGSLYQIGYWSKYFNVDTNKVIQRTYLSLRFSSDFLLEIDPNADGPDLWGPFWIPTTLIYCIFAASVLFLNICSVLGYTIEGKYDIGILSTSIIVIYFYLLFMSIFVSFGMKYFGSDCSLIEAFVIYGYSTAAWIPVTIFCMIPITFVRWAAVLAGFGISGEYQ
ncbi:hypothetical protein BB559_007474 [Furculomyces boomerangus]|uniref:Protein YIP n=2 Tax=Harpellales TaxID=61421 RepID=A0A2T9XX66_9FUNG|nr:hypothetical protein BB559_007474 [Furculomyces boomerangus]PVZ98370.1 hypothetical protein BB558_005635 [Smittium angustum]